MKNKKVLIGAGIIVALVAVVLVCVFVLGNGGNKDDLKQKIENGEPIEIIVKDNGYEVQGTKSQITWTQLSNLANYADFRLAFEQILGISSASGIKNGIAYINLDGKTEQNNTLYNAFMNKSFVDNYWNNEKVQQAAKMAASENYADVESDSETAKYAAVNAYWNLLPDNEPNFFNGGASLTRAEAMTLIMRATTPVSESGAPNENVDFTTAVGESDYTDYASYLDNKAFINTSDKSLNNQTFNGTMTRGEFIYLLINNTFGADTINNVDTSSTKLNDCKDGGSKIEAQKFGNGDYSTSYKLVYALQNPDNGAPTPIYKALVKAKQLDIISAETAWDEAITKTDAINLFIETIQAYANSNGYAVDINVGSENELAVTLSNWYSEHQSEITLSEKELKDKYNSFKDAGLYHDEILEKILSAYAVSKEVETEAPTEAPTEVEKPTIPEELQSKKDYTISWSNPYFFTKKFNNGTEKVYFTYRANLELFGMETTAIGVIPEDAKYLLDYEPEYYINGQTDSPDNNNGSTSNTEATTENKGNTSGSNNSSNESRPTEAQYTEIDGVLYMIAPDGTLEECFDPGTMTEEEYQEYLKWREEIGLTIH